MFWFQLLNCVIALLIMGLLDGIVFAIIPTSFFDINVFKKSFRFEQNGKFYDKAFKISRWKDKLPQFNKIVHIGYKKDKIREKTKESYEKFAIETIRAEIAHWFLIVISPLHFIYLDVCFAVAVILISSAANLLYVAIQRYNRIRILRILEKMKNKF